MTQTPRGEELEEQGQQEEEEEQEVVAAVTRRPPVGSRPLPSVWASSTATTSGATRCTRRRWRRCCGGRGSISWGPMDQIFSPPCGSYGTDRYMGGVGVGVVVFVVVVVVVVVVA